MAEVRNRDIAKIFERTAELLELYGANEFRVRSYRNAADEIRHARRPVAELYDSEGRSGVRRIPGVGQGLAGSIGEIVETGRLRLLDDLEGELSPEALFERLPGVGPKLAGRIHEELGVETFEELEVAAHDGRLEAIEGVGHKTAEGIRLALAGMLTRSAQRSARRRVSAPADEPPVDLLLEVDREYRRQADAGQLPTIAPRRFNPERVPWLPIMQTEAAGWRFRVLFSNTKRAHELDKTHEWVVIYCERPRSDCQYTVVTASGGQLAGKRVVRGREAECRRLYN
jgi:DNA polymerase (family X)